jgi:YidC/Oxa1 family membrane protein insertase
LQTEKLLSEQRRVSTICYDENEEGFDYLSETSEDDKSFENEVNWIAYKQSYFSSFLKPKSSFQKKGTAIKVTTYDEGSAKDTTHIKDFISNLTLNLDKNSNNTASFSWYFGPNDYEILNEYDADYDNVLNFGWGLFRWINIYAVQPVFNFLLSLGLGLGLAIFLLTFLIKMALMPVQWKMFVSSVKMRILKPKTEAINAKFPNKDDAMKKQMEMMNLYKQSGASPLSGCLPMLIQMPILLAVFRFFPSSFGLRQQSFLWADDLSSYDSILDFGFSIPLYGDHISLFTLLMSATTVAYTFMNSGNVQQPTQPGMPNMKVLMYLLPVMMIFFFNNYASGLSYYYFISTLFSILIMFMIKRFFVDEEKLKQKMENMATTAAASGPKKKSRFQERLEEMQKKQQEALKNKKK